MIRRVPLHVICAAVVFLGTFLAPIQDPASKIEMLVGGEAATFVSLENGVCHFKTLDGKELTAELASLPFYSQKEIMDLTGWGRVWESKVGEFRVVADMVEAVESAVVLEKIDGSTIVVAIDQLSNADQTYIEARRNLTSKSLPDEFSAKVVGVYDGDTVTLLLNRRQYKVRLSGIDSPEMGQAFGQKAKKHLSELVHGKVVSGVRETTDKYGRNVCLLTIDGQRVDYEMLKSGLAWHYVKYSNDDTRTSLEAESKSKKLNIWSESGPIEPWEWRKWGSAKRKEWLAEKNKPEPLVKLVGDGKTKTQVFSMSERSYVPIEWKSEASGYLSASLHDSTTSAVVNGNFINTPNGHRNLWIPAGAYFVTTDSDNAWEISIGNPIDPPARIVESSNPKPGIAKDATTKPAAPMKTHWLNTNGGVRHNQSCRWYANTKEGHLCSSSEGRACQKCGG